MKGEIKIEIKVTDECGAFPITKTFTITQDNTYESIEEWIEVFKQILYVQGFQPETIKEIFKEGEE
jgi:hypothetical protein